MLNNWVFNVAEKPVKDLLKSYFLEVSLLHNTPSEYKTHATIIKLDMSTEFLQKESLLKIPNKSAEASLLDKEQNEWILKLDIVPSSTKWDENRFNKFQPDQVTQTKHTIGNMIRACQGVFSVLKKTENNKKLMNTLTLETDPENLTLFIKDSRVSYSPQTRIGTDIYLLTIIKGTL